MSGGRKIKPCNCLFQSSASLSLQRGWGSRKEWRQHIKGGPWEWRVPGAEAVACFEYLLVTEEHTRRNHWAGALSSQITTKMEALPSRL